MGSYSVSDALWRFQRHDITFNLIEITNSDYTDNIIDPLVDRLLQQPNGIMYLDLRGNQLTDKIGIKLARFISISSRITRVCLLENRFSDPTYAAIAAALRTNTSLRHLNLLSNMAVDKNRIESLFVDALMLNPNRPVHSNWSLFENSNDYRQLKEKADKIGHPSLQSLLSTCI
jgi:hypothetical protein